MQISSILDIIDGKLLNSPSISFIYSFKTNASKVKEGDLFIAQNINDIELAVNNGAFAIILENTHPIIDNEIAWIKVDSINLSLIQLIRFKLATLDLEVYSCDLVSYDFLDIFKCASNKNIKMISDNLFSFVESLDEISDDTILFSKNKAILDKVYPNNKKLNPYNNEIKNLVEHSLFEVSFSYEDKYLQRIKIPSLYLSQFFSIKKFLNYEFDYSKLKNFNHLKAIFLDKSLNIIDFGKSDKFILAQNNEVLFNNEIQYLKNKFKYGKTIFITNKYISTLDENQILVKDIKDIRATLKNNIFNAAYIIGYSIEDVYDNLLVIEKEVSLF